MYSVNLPHSFPYIVYGIPEIIKQLVTALLDDDRTDVPNGSSFAVTVDGHTDNSHGTWKLWLSKSSFNYLESIDYLNIGLDIRVTVTER